MFKFNFYTKILSIVIVLLIPVLILYVYSNQTTTGVLREELNQSNYNQLTFFQNQVNTNIEMISSGPHLLIHDSDGAGFYDQKELSQSIKNGWQVSKKRMYGKDQFIFSLYTLSPFSSLGNPETANTIIKVEFDSSNIQDMLDRFKGDGRKEPFYYDGLSSQV